jgi:hypothetical protein
MGFFDDVGREFGTFFTRTVPGIGRDIGNTASSIYHDAVGLSRDIIHVPNDIVKSITPLADTVITRTGAVATNVVQTATSAVQQTVTQTAKSFFESPIVLIGGGLALLFLLNKSGGAGNLGGILR